MGRLKLRLSERVAVGGALGTSFESTLKRG
jgi:hypothetical protein